MNEMMGSVCESASSLAAVYLAPLAAAIAVAAF